MARVNLTENIWYDPEGTNYVMLDVTDQIPLQHMQAVDGVELLPKDEYHVSLVAAGKLSSEEYEVGAIIGSVKKYLDTTDQLVEFVRLADEQYVCHKNGEVTLIAPAEIVGLDGLRDVVRARYPEYTPPFPHVTLLKSANSEYGIGINSTDDFERYCVPRDAS